jgi:putative oxidoreductase
MVLFEINGDLALLLLRIIIGIIFVLSGYKKLFVTHEKTSKFLDGAGFKPAGMWAWILGAGELLGGLSVLLGLWIWYGAFVLAFVMLVALLLKLFKWKSGFKAMQEDLLLLAGNLVLMALGAGTYILGKI